MPTTSKLSPETENGGAVLSELFWVGGWGAESVTKAMTSQLCFHSFTQGGGRGGMRKEQQLLNLTGLDRDEVCTNSFPGLWI